MMNVQQSEAQAAQRDAALLRANGVRKARAKIKRQLLDGELTLEELLDDPPREVLRATIGEVLEWLPGIGRWRCQRILATGIGAPGVGRLVPIGNLSNASKARVVVRYEQIRPTSYEHGPLEPDDPIVRLGRLGDAA